MKLIDLSIPGAVFWVALLLFIVVRVRHDKQIYDITFDNQYNRLALKEDLKARTKYQVWFLVIVALGALGIYAQQRHHVKHMIYAAEVGFDDGWSSACHDIFRDWSGKSVTFHWQGENIDEKTCDIWEQGYVEAKQSFNSPYSSGYGYTGLTYDALTDFYEHGYRNGFDTGASAAETEVFQNDPEPCIGSYCLNYQNTILTGTSSGGKNSSKFR